MSVATAMYSCNKKIVTFVDIVERDEPAVESTKPSWNEQHNKDMININSTSSPTILKRNDMSIDSSTPLSIYPNLHDDFNKTNNEQESGILSHTNPLLATTIENSVSNKSNKRTPPPLPDHCIDDTSMPVPINVDIANGHINKKSTPSNFSKYPTAISPRLPFRFKKKEKILNGGMQSLLETMVKKSAFSFVTPLGLEEYFNECVVDKRNILLDYQRDKELPEYETMINESWQKLVVVFIGMSLFLIMCCILPLLLYPS